MHLVWISDRETRVPSPTHPRPPAPRQTVMSKPFQPSLGSRRSEGWDAPPSFWEPTVKAKLTRLSFALVMFATLAMSLGAGKRWV
jgi:hypothetical protein